MKKEVKMFTVKCDCCEENYEGEEFAAWTDYDHARDNALDSQWIEKEAQDEHEDAMHFCPECFTINDDDIVTTKNGITFQN